MFVSLYQNANTHAFDIKMQAIEWPFSSFQTKQLEMLFDWSILLTKKTVRKGSNGHDFVFTKSYVRMIGDQKKSKDKVFSSDLKKKTRRDCAKTNGKRLPKVVVRMRPYLKINVIVAQNILC